LDLLPGKDRKQDDNGRVSASRAPGQVSRRAALRLAGAASLGVALAACGGPDVARTAAGNDEAALGLEAARNGEPPLAGVAPPIPKHTVVNRVTDLHPDAPPNAIALTIDDGPSPIWTPQVLDVLARHQVLATFCMVGAYLPGQKDLVKHIMDSGHQLANHTMHHPLYLGSMSKAAVNREMQRASNAIYDATGVAPHLFRAPGGAWNKRITKAAAENGMVPIDWDVDPRDWSNPGIQSIIDTMLKAKPGDILLCHDGGGGRDQTVAALETVLPQLKSQGLQFVTL
jgi:peptidoglycan-N-acetylglucosamine deacetylase